MSTLTPPATDHQTRDLSPVLPKKLRYIYNRILLNYLLLGLGAITTILSIGQHKASEQVRQSLSSLPCPLWAIVLTLLLLFLALTAILKYKASAIIGNILLLLTAAGLMYAGLLPTPDGACSAHLGTIYLAATAAGLLGASLLCSSSRAMLIEMGPRHHAIKRLNLAECVLPIGGILAALCATLGYKSELGLLIPSGTLALLALVNTISTIKMPAADLSPWQPVAPSKAALPILTFLTYGALAASAAFSLTTRQFIPCHCDDVIYNPPTLALLTLLLASLYLLGKIIHSILLSKGSTKKICALFILILFASSCVAGTNGDTAELFNIAALPISRNVISLALYGMAIGIIDSLLCTTASQQSTGLSLRLHSAQFAIVSLGTLCILTSLGLV